MGVVRPYTEWHDQAMLGGGIARALVLGVSLVGLLGGCNLIFRYQATSGDGSAATDSARDGVRADRGGEQLARDTAPRPDLPRGDLPWDLSPRPEAGGCSPALCGDPNHCLNDQCVLVAAGGPTGPSCICPSGVTCLCPIASCENGSIQCSGTGTCNIICSDSACGQVTISCGSGPCQITCGQGACAQVFVECPSGPCQITCGGGACGSVPVECPSGKAQQCCDCVSNTPCGPPCVVQGPGTYELCPCK